MLCISMSQLCSYSSVSPLSVSALLIPLIPSASVKNHRAQPPNNHLPPTTLWSFSFISLLIYYPHASLSIDEENLNNWLAIFGVWKCLNQDRISTAAVFVFPSRAHGWKVFACLLASSLLPKPIPTLNLTPLL